MPKPEGPLTVLFLLTACGEQPPPPAPERKRAAPTPAPLPAPVPAPTATKPQRGEATEILRRYYSLIEQRRYAEAHALREPKETDAAAFAAHFDRVATQRVTIGTPSEPVEFEDWLYVEVPIQTYGMMKNGDPIASAGTVTLRKGASGGAWRIFTKG